MVGRLSRFRRMETAFASLLLHGRNRSLAMRSAANVSQQVRRYRINRRRLPMRLKSYPRSVKMY